MFRDRDRQDPEDGVVWRIPPEGTKSLAATGIADPNFILVLRAERMTRFMSSIET